MEKLVMNLKVLLPFQVFDEIKNVSRIVLETSKGSYGVLPQRLDCVAAIVPGILTYETEEGGVHYLAVDEGVLVKAGLQVMLSVRNAIGGADLGKLHESVKKEFMNLDESERNVRSVMAKMESGFMYSLEKFHKE
ncbi:MAG: F0F1 ATP synthase subunit epsilon [Chitinophagaceae bacterium]